MKRLFAMILVLLMLGASAALVETVDGSVDLPDLTAYSDAALEALAEAVKAEQESRGIEQGRETLQKGDKGDDVVALQKRLIELNYLSGSADGDYGNNTKSAVELFQKEAGLSATGIADAETQQALYAEDAPVAKVYLSLDFDAISRDPGSYKGKNYTFSGKVVQVMEQEALSSTYVVLRIATRGNYDDVVYVTYYRDSDEARILEDDRVIVYGTCEGLHTYETVLGSSVTLPKFSAESVSLK